jgi:septum site-determining protein MinC
MRDTATISIVGIKGRCIFRIDPYVDIKNVFADLTEILNKHKNFFNNSSLRLDVKSRLILKKDCDDLLSLVNTEFGVTIEGVYAKNPDTITAFNQAGVKILEEEPASVSEVLKRKAKPTGKQPLTPARTVIDKVKSTALNARLIYSTIRSGQALQIKGSVVIVGDVNPGAEVVAKGDIVVMGSLRGTVHAGEPDDNTAKVIALHLCPTLLRIGNVMAAPPEDIDSKKAFKPEMALIEDNQILIVDLM